MSAVILSLVTAASAQDPSDWVFQGSAVLSPDPGIAHMTTTISNPAVVYDSVHDRWLMLFETLISNTEPRCPAGVWGLGAAFSTDGLTWTAFANPVLSPNPAASRFYNCIAAHPTAIFNPNYYGGAGGILVFFKSGQVNDACAVTTPTWGCNELTGFGRLQIELDLVTGNPKRAFITPKPVHQPATTTFGYPHAIQDGAWYRIVYQAYPDIVSASSTVITNFATVTTELDQSALVATVPWAVDEFFNPAIVCDDDPVGAVDYGLFVGGRNTNGATVVSGSWAKVTRSEPWGDLLGWTFGVEQQSWLGNDAWRHWDITKLSTGEYLVFYDEKDATGNNAIHMGGTTLVFANTDAVSKSCP